MHILDELRARGLVQEVTNEELFRSLSSNDSFYHGIDPSASSMHLGNLVGVIFSVRLARAGIKPVMLFGGSTGSVGDPSGRSSERPILSREEIDKNCASIAAQVKNIFDRINVTPTFVNNYDWTQPVSVLDFLRDIGKYITVNYMLAKDSVTSRINSTDGISFTEFTYMLLQGFDFYHLLKSHGCKLQVGGSDQFGNMTAGLEIIRKKDAGEAVVLSYPLLLDSEGKKFGKSAGNAVWLDPKRFSPFEFYQYWLNVADAEIEKLLKVFSLKSLDEIASLLKEHSVAPEKRLAQKTLAYELTELVHSKATADEAVASSQVLFGGSTKNLSDEALLAIFANVPSSEIARAASYTALDLFASSSLCKSRGEAKRLIESGGAYIDQERVAGIDAAIETSKKVILLRSGKKSYHLLKIQ
jgi:tyrosyl-tRNA synthetase